jgi:2-polyprenyl-3-methyl-5-hydroxy-6-metoxy-1,4-benzoquinol methylase
MSESADQMHVYYAQRASYYDAVYERPERQDDIRVVRDLLRSTFAGRTVLEVACGTGYWTPSIAETAASVTATDGTLEPLAVARSRAGNEKVRFELADAYTLAGTLGVFQGAFAGLWLSHVPVADRARFLSSLHARLSQDARVILMDNNEVQLRDFPIVETDTDGNTYQLRTLRDGSVHRVLKNFPKPVDLHNMVDGVAASVKVQELQNFWLMEYTLSEA